MSMSRLQFKEMTENGVQVEVSVRLIEVITRLKTARHLTTTLRLGNIKARNKFTKKCVAEIEELIAYLSDDINELKE